MKSQLIKRGVYGSPVSCLSLYSTEWCFFGQGPFLHRVSLNDDGSFRLPLQCHGTMCSNNFNSSTIDVASQGGHTVKCVERVQAANDSSILVFLEGGTIHGIRHCTTAEMPRNGCDCDDVDFHYSVAFGGCQLSLVDLGIGQQLDTGFNARIQSPCGEDYQNVREMQRIPLTWSGESLANSPTTGSSSDWTAHDWIWDVQFCCRQPTTAHSCNDLEAQSITDMWVVGLAHNVIQIWVVVAKSLFSLKCLKDMPRYNVSVFPIQDFFCTNHGITNCLKAHVSFASPPLVSIAAGTSSNDILLWQIPRLPNPSRLTWSNEYNKVTHIHMKAITQLVGHKGVVSFIAWDRKGASLASTSDDRTVRMWHSLDTMAASDSLKNWKLHWTGWGHTARIWSLAFAEQGVVSVAEDGCAILWDLVLGTNLTTLQGHSCQSIRSISAIKHLVATGGDDGTVVFQDIQVHFQAKTKGYTDSTKAALLQHSCAQSTKLPDCQPYNAQQLSCIIPGDLVQNGEISMSKKQIVIGMCVNIDGDDMLVATRAGSLMILHFTSWQWTILNPWLLEQECFQGCCLARHPSLGVAVIGTTVGMVVIAPMDPVGSERSFVTKRLDFGHLNRAVQNVQWLRSNMLLVGYIREIRVIWIHEVQNLTDASNPCIASAQSITFNVPTSGVGKCFALNADESLLIAGDTRGNLILFKLDPALIGLALTNAIVRRVHGKEHVNAVIWYGNNQILSVGNDGYVHSSYVDSLGNINTVFSVASTKCTCLTHVWLQPTTALGRVITAGYFGNSFVLIDHESGFEIFRVNTEGRQRQLLVSNISLTSYNLGVAILAHQSHEQNMIKIHLCCKNKAPFFQKMHRIVLHGETIYGSSLFNLDPASDVLALVTGSEDCTTRLSIIDRGRLKLTKRFPYQDSCVKTICCSRHKQGSGTVVVAGGGKLCLQIFLVKALQSPYCTLDPLSIDVKFIGEVKHDCPKQIGQRVNHVAALPVNSTPTNTLRHLVIAGDSGGAISAYQVSETTTGRPKTLSSVVLHRRKHPVISVLLLNTCIGFVAVCGTTKGDVSLILVPGFLLDGGSVDFEPIQQFFEYQAHSIGTNSISAIVLEDGYVRIVSGGDDQSVHCCDILLSFDDNHTSATIVRQVHEEGASSSAIKGVFLMNNEQLIVTGYDQRLTTWLLEWPLLTRMQSVQVDVGDINSLCGYSAGKNDTFVVCGAGVEIFTRENTV
jgi:WD40 repeat protein